MFIGIGAHKGVRLDVGGEDGANVYSAVRFLHMVNSGDKVALGSRVVVVGGGHSALVIARVVRRLGAKVTVLYRRTIVEMPATEEEVDQALAEGVDIQYLLAPVGIRTKEGKAVAVVCTHMKRGEPDHTGRRRPIPVNGSRPEVDCTALISIASHGSFYHAPEETLRLLSVANERAQQARLKLVAVLAAHGVFNYEAPDFSTKEKAQEIAGVPLQELVQEKLTFKASLAKEWEKTAIEEGRLNPDARKGMSDKSSYSKN